MRNFLYPLPVLGLSAFLLAGILSQLQAQISYPNWWLPTGSGGYELVDDSVITTQTYPFADSSELPASDSAPALLGQAKHMVYQTKLAMDTEFAAYGGAGTELDALVATFTYLLVDNYSPIVQGQLKYLLDPVYDRLLALGYSGDPLDGMGYPWTGAVDNDDKPIVIGQLKYVFNFDFDDFIPSLANDPDGDIDEDGLSNAIEDSIIAAFGGDGVLTTHLSVTATGDADGDGLDNLGEQTYGTDPIVAGTELPFADDFESQVSWEIISARSSIWFVREDFEGLVRTTAFDFESSSSGWSYSGSPIYTRVTDTIGALGSDAAVQITGNGSDDFTLYDYFSSYNICRDAVRINFYLKADDSKFPEINISDIARIRFDETGGISVYDGSLGWSDPVVTVEDMTVWQQFTIDIDITQDRWSLYLNGTLVLGDISSADESISSVQLVTFLALATESFYLDEYQAADLTHGWNSDYLPALSKYYDSNDNALGTNASLKASGDGINAYSIYKNYDRGDDADSDVWLDFYLRVEDATHVLPSINISDVSKIDFGATGAITVYDGASAVTLDNTIDDSTQWQRISLYFDFSTKQWSFYINGELLDGAENLDFYDGTVMDLTSCSFAALGGEIFYLDEFQVGDDSTPWLISGSPATAGRITGSGVGANSTDAALKLAGNGTDTFELSHAFSDYSSSLIYDQDIWIDFYLKTDTSGNLPTITVGDALQLRFESTGNTANCIVYNGYDGQTINSVTGREIVFAAITDVDVWQRITFKLDYATGMWTFYLNGDFVASDLGFGQSDAEFAKIIFSADASDVFYLDEFFVDDARGTTLLLIDTDGDGNSDVDEATDGTDPDQFDSDYDQLSDYIDADPEDGDLYTGYTQTALTIDFESSDYTLSALDSQQNWTGTSDAVAIVVNTDLYSEQVLELDNTGLAEGEFVTATLPIAAAGEDDLVISFYAKFPGRELSSDSEVDAEGLIYQFEVDDSGQLQAWDASANNGGGAWVSFDPDEDLRLDWHLYAIELDFQTRTWSLYLDNVLVEAFDGLYFLDPELRWLTQFSMIHYGNGGSSTQLLLDNLAVQSFQQYWDLDGDGLPDLWEFSTFGDRSQGADDDYDYDGISNLDEFTNGTDVKVADEDSDGIPDGITLPTGAVVTTFVDPYSENFESYSIGNFTSGSGDWVLEDDAIATISTTAPQEAVQSLSMSASTGSGMLSRFFNSSGAQSVWIDYYLKPDFDTTEPATSIVLTQTTAFYFDASGQLYYYDGARGQWYSAGSQAIATANTWQRITIHQDFSTQEWSFYLEGKRVIFDQPFSNPAPWFYSFAYMLNGSDLVELDQLKISSATKPADLDDDADGLLNNQEDIDLDGNQDVDEDIDGDGNLDIAEDLDGDGNLDVDEDLNANGILDTGEDIDGDGYLDVAEDVDNDGHLDVAEDIDGDGFLDINNETDSLNWDSDGDYVSDGDEESLEAALDSTNVGVYVSLPVSFDFESYALDDLNTQDGWEGLGVSVIVDPDDMANQFVQLLDDGSQNYLFHPVAPSNSGREVYIHFDANLQPGTTFDPSSLSDVKSTILLTLDSSGQLAAYDGQASFWQIDTDSGLTYIDTWHHYRITLNTFTASWSLWVDDNLVFENIPARDDESYAYYFWSFYYQGLNSSNHVLIDNLTLSYDSDTDFTTTFTLPLQEDFTGYSTTDLIADSENCYWTLAGAGTAATILTESDLVSPTDFDLDGVSLTLTAGSEDAVLSHSFEAQSTGYVTARFAIKPVFLTSVPAISSSGPADFYFDADGKLHVSDGSLWIEIEDYSFSADTWYTFTLVFDLDAQTWRLDIDDQTVLLDLSFANQLFYMDAFTLIQRSTASTDLRLDSVSVIVGAPPLITASEVSLSGSAAIGQSYYILGDIIQFGVTAQDVDTDADLTVEFFNDSDVILATDDESPYTVDYLTTVTGEFEVYVVASDVDGLFVVSEIKINVSLDDDSNDLPDAWEEFYFDDTTGQDSTADLDGDGYDNAAELLNGSDPTDYYNFEQETLAIIPLIFIESGDGQTVTGDVSTEVTVKITDQQGNLLIGAPFTLTGDTALFDLDADPSDGINPLSGVTGSDGTETFTFQP
jgi:hypothetical protein